MSSVIILEKNEFVFSNVKQLIAVIKRYLFHGPNQCFRRQAIFPYYKVMLRKSFRNEVKLTCISGRKESVEVEASGSLILVINDGGKTD